MKTIRFLVLSGILIAFFVPSLCLGEEDLNDVAYNSRIHLNAGTIWNYYGNGDCLIFPYYDVRKVGESSQVTTINIENYGEYGVSAKLRFRDWSRGNEIFSKDIWIPSKSTWSATVELNQDGSNAVITGAGNVVWRFDANTFYFTNALLNGVPFSTRNLRKAAGESTLYGFIEVIGEEKTSPDDKGGKTLRLAQSERDCPNTLRGSLSIDRVSDGTTLRYEAVAIGNFSRGQGSLFRKPGSPYPILQNGEDTLDQIEFQLGKYEIFGPFSVTPSNQGKTSLIITFPTRQVHYPHGKRENKINNPFAAQTDIQGETLKTSLSKDGAPLPADSDLTLPYAVNVIGLYKGYGTPPSGIDNLAMPVYSYDTGEVKLTAGNMAQRILIQDYEYFREMFTAYRGLPAFGLLLQESRNPNALAAGSTGSLTPVEFSAVWEESSLESVVFPTFVSGPTYAKVGDIDAYATGGAASTVGHPIQYFFDWGDGTNSGWLPAGTVGASKTWANGGLFLIRTQARCSIHTDIVSKWSNGLVVTVESVSPPTSLTGPVSGIPNVAYTYTASGAVSSVGHPVEYQFDWKGDGSDLSGWGSGTQTKVWTVGGVYTVRARARSVIHTGTVSDWTSGLTVTIESITTPTAPVGPSFGTRGVEYTFGTGGAVSNLGHPLEYQFDWGDGTISSWGSPTRAHVWNNFTDFQVRARARCAIDPTVVSDWSEEASFSIELVTVPSQPNGNLNGMRGKPYTYTAAGAVSTNNHTLEYQFDWGDGSTSPWTVAGADPITGATSASAVKVWALSGAYTVRARARCQQHPDIMSDWSSGLVVAIEFTSIPVMPSGPTSGTVGEGYLFGTGGSTVDSGHPVQYHFDWGNGTTSEWLPIGVTSVGKAWPNPGTYAVRAQARCAIHTDVISDWSPVLSVTIVPGPPPQLETISTPFITAQGPITGKRNIPYTLAFQSGISNLSHAVEHQFDWGDGTFSSWGGSATKAWSASATYTVKVRARCVQHPSVVSEWSSGVPVVIDFISTPQPAAWDPSPPAGGLGQVGVSYDFKTAGGSTSEIGQDIEYRFNWGDGTDSGWLGVGVPPITASHTYAGQGTFAVTVEARGVWYLGSGGTTQHMSDHSTELLVTIRP